MPSGADAVVPVEECTSSTLQCPPGPGPGPDPGPTVHVGGEVRAGQHVRPVGFDVAAGEVVVAAGSLVGPHEVGIMATVGAARVMVHRRPKLALLSTAGAYTRPLFCAT
jgi:molybdopterin biosynthesis enzyme